MVPEFSRPVSVELLPKGGVAFAVEAGPDELAALRVRFALERIDRLCAEGRIIRDDDAHFVRLEGSVDAQIVQLCVVTLEPVESRLAFTIERLFDLHPEQGATDLVLEPDALDIEPLDGSSIDVGEIVAEELSLNLEVYPRADGADAALAELTGVDPRSSAFAALAPLSRRNG